jgi:hypothetical protein
VNKVENVQIVRFQPAGRGPLACETRFILYEAKQWPQMRPSAAVYRRRVEKNQLILFNLFDYKRRFHIRKENRLRAFSRGRLGAPPFAV